MNKKYWNAIPFSNSVDSFQGLQQSDLWSSAKGPSNVPSAAKLAEPKPGMSIDAALLGKPKR